MLVMVCLGAYSLAIGAICIIGGGGGGGGGLSAPLLPMQAVCWFVSQPQQPLYVCGVCYGTVASPVSGKQQEAPSCPVDSRPCRLIVCVQLAVATQSKECPPLAERACVSSWG